MSTSTKQLAYNSYLQGCQFLGMEPEFEYTERTAKQIAQATEALRTRYRNAQRKATVDSVKRNTANAVAYVEQGIGEPLANARDRAIALAKRTGRAIPFRITRK